VLQFGGGGPATVSDLTIQNGRATGLNGGGVFNSGTLLLRNVVLTGNTATGGTGGGAVFNIGTLTLEGCELVANDTPGVGGAILGWYGSTTTLLESSVDGNSADQGGGIYSLGTLVVSDSTLSQNFAAQFGGGLAVFGGSSELSGVTVSGNETDGYGAGLVNNFGALDLVNVTVSGNSGPNYSGVASLTADAQTSLTNSSVAGNLTSGAGVTYGGVASVGSVVSFQNSLVAGNEGRNCLVNGVWTSLGHNLSGDGYCSFDQPGDIENADPLLAPLGDYGGPTWTHALLPDSPAIDTGGAGCPAVDQRGVSRPADGDGDGNSVCDIGAYEARNQIGIDDVTVLEGDAGTTGALFTLTLTPASQQAVTVSYATADGTATAGSDYQAASGSVTFNPGQASRTVAIQVIGDTADEPDETFTVNLSAAANADIVDSAGLATIVDDDGQSSLSIADASVDEGNSGTASATLVVTLSPADSQVVTVQFGTVDGTAKAGDDYIADSGVLTFNPGETSRQVIIQAKGDILDEGDSEAFEVLLSNPTNAGLADASAQAVIADDDTARVTMDSGVSMTEGNAGATQAVFSVSLTTPAAFAITVDFASASGVGGNFASPGVDYQDVSGSLSFAPGDTQRTFSVPVLGDTQYEVDEIFTVQLSNAHPVSIYGSTAIGTILNDDVRRVFLPLVLRRR
jgi:hypothetical protein